jgi:hypothetical protein
MDTEERVQQLRLNGHPEASARLIAQLEADAARHRIEVEKAEAEAASANVKAVVAEAKAEKAEAEAASANMKAASANMKAAAAEAKARVLKYVWLTRNRCAMVYLRSL